MTGRKWSQLSVAYLWAGNSVSHAGPPAHKVFMLSLKFPVATLKFLLINYVLNPVHLGLTDIKNNNTGLPVTFDFQINNEYFFSISHAICGTSLS